MRKFQLTSALFVVLAFSPLAENAHAYVGVRIGIGVPLYVGPGPYYYGYRYGYPYGYGYGYPYYPPAYAPPPPVYQLPPPVVVAPPASAPIPAPYAAPVAPSAITQPPTIRASSNVIPASGQSSAQVDALLRQLGDPTDTVRRDAALDLGRMKAFAAIDALTNVLQKDASPVARDGAARAMGLIGSSQCLKALIYAAQADNDRDVRHSAQFAVEVIRTNLRGN